MEGEVRTTERAPEGEVDKEVYKLECEIEIILSLAR
jgi:hypothetical protein